MDDTVGWLLDSDPALRWQVERDLLHAPDDVWQATRAKVATEGFGARLLALQDPDGQWAGGAYFPADFDFEGPEATDDAGQPWTATTWSLTALREWGLDASVLAGTVELLDANSRWEYDDLPYWGGEVDCCINALVLANGAWLGADVAAMLEWFDEHRMDDGGWNCGWVDGSVRSSVHSTLNTLKGLVAYEAITGRSTKDLRQPGEDYLLDRGLYRRLTTGEPVGPWALALVHPARWIHNVLSAAECVREASLLDGTPPDPRIADAIARIREQRQPDGTWLQARRHPGRVWFEVDVPAGEPSRWLTMSAMRVLDWWDGR
ncbi:squalene cyclase [Euzebya rosea]|uniref:squalene cyclase n=1 Tax=Euzebya rosea TaxID=2052804 RepID=UPI000D3E36D5|nr:squalene cyclase [Euzebya rosea]